MKEITTNKNILNENSVLLQDFFKDINRYKISDNQIELAKKAKNGDEQAREDLITSNLRFVVTCAKHFTGQGVPLLDLIQSGIVGLILAIENYDPDKGYKFISFAVWYIRREIMNAIYSTGRTIRYPTTYISKITKTKKAHENFIAKNHREPTDDELIELTNLTQKQYDSVILDKSYCQSLDTPVSNDEKTTLKDIIEDKIPEYSDSFTIDTINDGLKFLNERERKVITEFYGLNGCEEKTIKEIAKELNLGEERIRQLRKGGIIKLRQRYGNVLKTLL